MLVVKNIARKDIVIDMVQRMFGLCIGRGINYFQTVVSGRDLLGLNIMT